MLTSTFAGMSLCLLLSLGVGSLAVRRQNRRLRWLAISLMVLGALLGVTTLLLAWSVP